MSLILSAKTSFGKSLIFNVLPLLLPSGIGIVLTILTLKLINKSWFNRVKSYDLAKAFVHYAKRRAGKERAKTAPGFVRMVVYLPMHGDMMLIDSSVHKSGVCPVSHFYKNVIRIFAFRKRMTAVLLDEVHFVDGWPIFVQGISKLHVLRTRLAPLSWVNCYSG